MRRERLQRVHHGESIEANPSHCLILNYKDNFKDPRSDHLNP